MPISYPPYPMQVNTPLGDGFVVYINDNNLWENDEVCVALCDGGQWKHFNTSQIKSYHNSTYGIIKKDPNANTSNS